MIDQLIELALSQGIWCALGIYLIIQQNRKLNKLELWVQDEVLTTLQANTSVMKDIKEIVNANKDRR